MHMLATSLTGIAVAAVIGLAAPHYAPAASVVMVIYTILGLFSAWIAVREA
ncbi:hypothetical protein GOB93_02325 [Acetobacter musti]|uniref:Uncharacterized protein n=1 Tax=Acetobacter musti TaxID=864732 RepID=A0ABX0JIF5_9PROT|nr:hypothetical protein [Acetobacter musti]NHN83476.1 hypothetical protein [Acetobacter musti]